MVQKQSYLVVADNSGAKELMVIHIVGSTKKRYAYLGDLVVCSVKEAIPGGMVKKKQIVLVRIVRTRKEFRRDDGTYVRFDDNAGVIVKKEDGEPMGTRLFGPVARELLTFNKKFGSLAQEVV